MFFVQSLLPVFDKTQEGGLTAIGGSEDSETPGLPPFSHMKTSPH